MCGNGWQRLVSDLVSVGNDGNRLTPARPRARPASSSPIDATCALQCACVVEERTGRCRAYWLFWIFLSLSRRTRIFPKASKSHHGECGRDRRTERQSARARARTGVFWCDPFVWRPWRTSPTSKLCTACVCRGMYGLAPRLRLPSAWCR
jgi:hypothetical protein